jgi:hypothetical protein
LQGCLLAAQAGEGPRGRFYLLAEPGLTALLLYGAARLLPESVTALLTFSTYESLHALRSYKLTRVVGTYTVNPGKGLEKDFFAGRDYALDTFSGKAANELQTTASALDDLVELAVRGEVDRAGEVYTLLERSGGSIATFREGLAIHKAAQRLAVGEGQVADVRLLRRSAQGRHLIAQHGEAIWPVVRDGCLADEGVRQEFADLLVQHLPELVGLAGQALAADSHPGWQQRWGLLRSLLREDPGRLRESFLQAVAAGGAGVSALRLPLLLEWRQVGAAELPTPLRRLLRELSAADLERLVSADVPREWVAEALLAVRKRPDTASAAVRHLRQADGPLLRAFWERAQGLKDGDLLELLLGLIPPGDGPGSRALLARLLQASCVPCPEVADGLLEALGAYGWGDFWSDGRLTLLLQGLVPFGEESAPVWAGFVGQLNQQLLLGAAAPKGLLTQLEAAAAKLGSAVPARTARVIEDWALLRRHFEKHGEGVRPTELAAVCTRLDLEAEDLLRAYFEQFILPRGVSARVLDPFVAICHGFWPAGDTYEDHRERLRGWLQVLGACPDEAQALYQRHYLEDYVPYSFRHALVEDFTLHLHPRVQREIQRREPPGPWPKLLPRRTGGFWAWTVAVGVRLALMVGLVALGAGLALLLGGGKAPEKSRPTEGQKKAPAKAAAAPVRAPAGGQDANQNGGPAWPDPRPVVGQVLALGRPVRDLGAPLVEGAGQLGQVLASLAQAKGANGKDAVATARLHVTIVEFLQDDIPRLCSLDPETRWAPQLAQLERLLGRLRKAAGQPRLGRSAAQVSERLVRLVRDAHARDWTPPQVRRRLAAALDALEEHLLDINVSARELEQLVRDLPK